ncbi:MAG TPA: rod shape-determining protein MreC [Candidatus Paceibacterota bacterium]|nr:rod shape-determining protein MreC [Candidatus Paceibacterota bacterium]
MKLRSSALLIAAIVITLAAVGLVGLVFKSERIAAQPFADSAARAFSVSGKIRQWAEYIVNWKRLARENEQLRSQLDQTIAALGTADALEKENNDLRSALHLAEEVHRNAIPAGLFNVSLMPDGYSALINKGKNDGIAAGDAVVTLDGALLGTIQEVFDDSARVTLVTDPSFKVTVRVLGEDTTGIVRGDLAAGMRLDLVVQSDRISEGDTLISTGNDLIPAGLVVGTVNSIHTNDAELFQSITVSPSAAFGTGSVVVIHR